MLTRNSSETESDSVPSDDGAASSSKASAFPVWDPRHPKWSTPLSFELEVIRQDIEILLRFDLTCFKLGQDAHHLDDLFFSSARILACVTSLPTTPLGTIISIFSVLVDPNFLERSFEYRRLFRRAAQQYPSIQHRSTVVTWIEEFFVKLCSLTGNLISGSLESPPPNITASIQTHLNTDAIRAACQLPDKWEDLNNAIGSPRYSPAAKRMALTLMFATYVMGPRLTSKKPGLQHPHIPLKLDSLFDAAKNMYSREQSPSTLFLQEKVSAAMLLSLFPVVDVIGGAQKPLLRPSQLRPEGLAYLLDLISIVMGKGAVSFHPLERLDTAQVTLLRWGSEVVPWSWSTWTDQRSADTEYLCSMTSTWLCHLNKPLFSDLLQSEDDNTMFVDLRHYLLEDPAASSNMVLQLLRNIVAFLNQEEHDSMAPPSELLFGILGKLCWSIVQILEDEIIKTNASIHNRIPEYAKCLLSAFCHLRSSQEELFARDMIIEALSLIRAELLCSCLQIVTQNRAALFVRKLDQAVRLSTRLLSDVETDHEQHGHLLHGAKSLLEFLTIIFLNCPEIKRPIAGVAQSYIGTIIGLLKDGTRCSSSRYRLLVPLLTNLCVSAKFICDQENNPDIEEIWTCLGPKSFLSAVTFAQLILISNTVCDPLTCYEAWDFLSSALTMIVNGRLSEEEEPLALLTCAAVCFALRKIIHSCDLLTRQIILSSPWTASLNTTIEASFENSSSGVAYLEQLRTRIEQGWKALAEEMSMQGTSDPSISTRLLYYRDELHFSEKSTSDICNGMNGLDTNGFSEQALPVVALGDNFRQSISSCLSTMKHVKPIDDV